MFAVRAVNNERWTEVVCPILVILPILLASWLLGTSMAHADSNVSSNVSNPPFEVPPAPVDAAPRHVLDLHSGFSTALQNDSLCPKGSGCVFQSGGGIGASLERRWPQGFGYFAGYDLWFLDSDSVYELGVQQVLRGGARYTMPTDILLHPVFELSAGGMGYGDTFRIATFGAVLQAFAGFEVEISETYGLLSGFGLRAFSQRPFITERDSVRRGNRGLFTESLFFQVGLTAM